MLLVNCVVHTWLSLVARFCPVVDKVLEVAKGRRHVVYRRGLLRWVRVDVSRAIQFGCDTCSARSVRSVVNIGVEA